MIILAVILLSAFAFFLVSIMLRLLKKPIKWIFKLLIHACLGYVFLFVFNFVGAWFDISLGMNWFNAAVTGILGVPGVILLLLIKYLL